MILLAVLLPKVYGGVGFLLCILLFLLFSSANAGYRRTLLARQELISYYVIIALVSLGLGFEPATTQLHHTATFSHQTYLIVDLYSNWVAYYLIWCTVFFLVVTVEYLLRCAV
jgi:hypothetical protein